MGFIFDMVSLNVLRAELPVRTDAQSTNLPLSLPGESLDLLDEGVEKGWFWKGRNNKGVTESGSTGLPKSTSSTYEDSLSQPTGGSNDQTIPPPVGPLE